MGNQSTLDGQATAASDLGDAATKLAEIETLATAVTG